MKIISKLTDYYDCIQSYGGYDKDDLIIFIRKKQKILVDVRKISDYNPSVSIHNWIRYNSYILINDEYSDKDFEMIINSKFVGYCGKLFPVLKVEIKDKRNFGNIEKYIEYVYSFEQLIIISKKYPIKEFLKSFNAEKEPKYYWRRQKFKNREFYRDYFNLKVDEQLQEYINIWNQLFFKHNTPIFSIEFYNHYNEYKIILNPKLKKYQFYKIKDAFTAYQEISYYLSGVLGITKEVSQIADKDMLIKKGFNDESFKTISPGKKKKSKRIRKK